MPSNETWKEYAHRDWGQDGYVFGDVSRHYISKLRVRGQQQSLPDVEDSDRALLDLKVQRDQLVQHRKRMERQSERDVEAAQNFIREGKKPQAMLALRKRKQHDQLALDCQTHLMKLEELIDSIEIAHVQKQVVQALATGVETLKRVQKEIGSADYVQQLLDERDEAMEKQREISDVLVSAGVAADDSEALAELARLEEAYAAEQLAAAGAPAASTDEAPPAAAEAAPATPPPAAPESQPMAA